MKVRILIIKPSKQWLSEKESEKGYWGFVRCRKDYEKEKENINDEFENLVKSIKKEGIEVNLLPTIEVKNVDDLLKKEE
ncbi:hypothetical protein J7K56_00200 [Candidatus Calescamantes bacterium]|nr:hypothetical protein [Candidatus Calescamantes bacterium]